MADSGSALYPGCGEERRTDWVKRNEGLHSTIRRLRTDVKTQAHDVKDSVSQRCRGDTLRPLSCSFGARAELFEARGARHVPDVRWLDERGARGSDTGDACARSGRSDTSLATDQLSNRERVSAQPFGLTARVRARVPSMCKFQVARRGTSPLGRADRSITHDELWISTSLECPPTDQPTCLETLKQGAYGIVCGFERRAYPPLPPPGRV